MITFLITACVLLGAGLVVTLIKLNSFKKDFRKIGENLKEITSIDTNAGLRTDTFDEDISRLIQSINNMLHNNRQNYLEVHRMEVTLKRAITNISHDLRTPLTSAKGYLQMAENADLDKETQLRYLSIIRGRLDALTVLMDSLFAFSRAVEGDLTLSRINIANILRDTLVDNFSEIESKGFVVETDIPDTPVYFNCDENALKRVVQNLITNAIVHGKEYLRVRLSDGTIEFANKADDLRDIDIHSMFERFYTADASRTGKRTGLGLAIVKELTEKMDGSISAAINDNMLIICVHLAEKNKKGNL
jgi:signal transduction histidine kinase